MAASTTDRRLRVLLTLLLASACVRARAALYATEAGYQYTGGSAGYWGDEAWAAGSLRLNGGWYPFGRLAFLTDSSYQWVLSPTAGLEKGFAGLGKARADYTYSFGDFRPDGVAADSHMLEVGWSKAFSALFSGDLAYQFIDGDLFAGAERVLGSGPRRVAVSQGQLTLFVDPPLGARRARLSAGASVAGTSDGRTIVTETLGARLPVVGALSLSAGLTLAQSGGLDQYYASGGLVCSFSGRR